MKRIATIFLFLATLVCVSNAQRALLIERKGGITDAVAVDLIEALTFAADGSTMSIASNGSVSTFSTADIKTLHYGTMPTAFTVDYDGGSATVTNPYLLNGVSVTASGANITVNNTNESAELSFSLTGNTSNGGFCYVGSYKTTIVLNGVSITNPQGPAIDIQCGKRVSLELKKGTENTLIDGKNGNWKAALYCKGHLEIDKTGTLNVTGNTKHAISAKEYIQLKKSDGTININGAVSDGIHCGQYFLANGYSVSINGVGGDGIQAELSGDEDYAEDYADGSLNIQGGTFVINVTADEAAGLKADTDVNINSTKSTANITITATGAGSRGIDADGNVTIADDATVIDITANGTGGVQKVDNVADTYYASCLKSDKAVTINGGTITLHNSGLMSKSIKAGNSSNEGTVTLNGGSVTAVISGTMYLNGTDATYCSAIKTDNFIGNGGSLSITASTGNASRGITADNSILITNGTYTITNSTNGQTGTSDSYTAKAITCDKNISIEGGTFNIRMTGTGGKGIKADGELLIGRNDGTGPSITIATTGSALGSSSSSQGGNMRPGGMGGMGGMNSSSNSSSSKAIKAEGAAYIKGGNLFVTTSTDGAEGLESKTSVTISGGTHYFQCYDDCINSAGIVNFAGGTTVCYAYGNDAVDSNYGKKGAITISGGNVFAYSTKSSPEEGLDCDNNQYIVVTGGIAVSAGGAQGGGSSSSIGSASQGYYIGSSPSSYSSSYYYTLCNTSGTPICTYKFAANVSNALSLLTAPNLGQGSFTVKTGTSKPTNCSVNVNDVFFINPTVTTTGTAATLTAK